MIFRHCAENLDNEDFQTIENRLKIEFPGDFKEHYLLFNGGIPERTFFYMERYDHFAEIRKFLPLKNQYNADDKWTIEYTYKFYTSSNAFPVKYLPFATDHGDNYFCIDLENSTIVLIYMDLGEISDKSIRFLSPNFGEFLSNLEETDDYDDDDDDEK